MPVTRTPAAAPRWSTLLGLGAGVLALHLMLLADGLPDLAAGPSPGVAEAPAASAPPSATPAAATAAAAPPPARISTVRWIAATPPPPPAVEPPPIPVARKPAAKPVRRAEPVAPAPAPAPAALPEPAAVIGPAPEIETPPPLAEAPGAEDPMAAPPPVEVAAATEVSELAQAAPAPAEAEAPAPPPPPAPDAAAAPALPPAQPPGSTRLHYAVSGQSKGLTYHASAVLDWMLDAGRYSARMEMRMFLLGSRVQTSTGQLGPEGLRPERFADQARSERAAHFEHDHHRIRFSSNAPDAALLPGAQDRLSLFLQMAGLLQARPQAYADGQVIEMQVAGTGDAEIWRFRVGEETTLALPAGELRARHLTRVPRKPYDSTVEMWLAPGLSHLPVRLRITQANGDVADQQLSQMP